MLKIYQKHHYKHFFKQLTTCVFFQKLVCQQDHSATLIDNIFTNQLDNHVSGELTNSISDHQMLFSYSNNIRIVQKQVKYLEVEVNNTNALNALLGDVESIDLQEKINFHRSADPNGNFDCFMALLSQAKQKCMPKKL